jgi:hypothetical protein
MKTLDEIKAEVDAKVDLSRQDWELSKKVAPNSYGTGYDKGFLDAFIVMRAFINGEYKGSPY